MSLNLYDVVFARGLGGGNGGSGGGSYKGMTIHVCASSEYDSETNIPTISEPDDQTIYLVPGDGDENNIFSEYIYVDGAWELFGSATVDLALDSTPTANSTNPVTSGGVKTALDGKQNTLTFDTTPTEYSTNPVTSGGIKTALNGKQDTLAFDTTPTANSTKPVTSGGIKTALDGKQNTLTFDTAPTVNSTKPVTSGGIKTAINAKQDKLIFDSVPTASSTNPVTSGGIKSALNDIEMQLTAATKSPLKASTAAAMSDTTKTYIYTGSETGYTFGNWYYYDGSSWTDGGIYNATAFETDKTLTIENMAADSKAVGVLKEALDAVDATLTHKADKDGTVASAEQLLSDVGTEDKAPYLFRATPYDSTRVDEEIVGCSVGWNQFLDKEKWPNSKTENGVTFTNNGDGSITVNGTATATASFAYSDLARTFTQVGHVYMIYTGVNITGSASTFEFMIIALRANGSNLNLYAAGTVAKCEYAEPSQIQLAVRSGATVNNLKFTPQVIDLTAWFGSAIADYAYTLETATAGSGVAFIKALLPGGYIPYSAPTLKSVSGLSAHVMRGFNQWDEIAEEGGISTSTGLNIAQTGRFRPKNYIPVFPGMTYNFLNKAHHNISLYYYRKDKSFVTSVNLGSAENSLIPIADDVYYVRFVDPATAVYTPGNICINVSNPTLNGQYKPYEAPHEYALDSDLTLRGILKMDSDHRVYADGDRHLPSGQLQRRFASVDLGTLNYTYQALSGSRNGFTVSISSLKAASSGSEFLPAISAKYSVKRYNDSWEDGDMSYFYPSSQTIVFINNAYTDAATFKTAMSGVYLVYELATETTETADPFASPQNCEPGGTEEYVYGESGSGVLVGHNSKYQKNMRSELERVSDAVPVAPSVAGTYSLKATVTAQGVTYAWVSD